MKLDHDPTSKLESKNQIVLRKIKSKLPENIYKKLYLQDQRQVDSTEMRRFTNSHLMVLMA